MFDFDATAYQPQTTLEPVPDDWYLCVISEQEPQKTKENTPDEGGQLVLKFKIQSGVRTGAQFAGRELRKNFGIWNKNPETVRIANNQLSAVCHVTGRLRLSREQGGAAVLVGASLQCQAVISKNDNRFNDVVAFKDINGNDPRPGQPAQSQQQPQMMPPAQIPPQQGYPQQQQAPQNGYASPPLPNQPTAFGGPPQGMPPQQQPQQQPQYAPMPPAPAPQYAPAPQQQYAPQGAPQGGFPQGGPAPAAAPAYAPAPQPQGGFNPPQGGGAPGANGRPW